MSALAELDGPSCLCHDLREPRIQQGCFEKTQSSVKIVFGDLVCVPYDIVDGKTPAIRNFSSRHSATVFPSEIFPDSLDFCATPRFA